MRLSRSRRCLSRARASVFVVVDGGSFGCALWWSGRIQRGGVVRDERAGARDGVLWLWCARARRLLTARGGTASLGASVGSPNRDKIAPLSPQPTPHPRLLCVYCADHVDPSPSFAPLSHLRRPTRTRFASHDAGTPIVSTHPTPFTSRCTRVRRQPPLPTRGSRRRRACPWPSPASSCARASSRSRRTSRRSRRGSGRPRHLSAPRPPPPRTRRSAAAAPATRSASSAGTRRRRPGWTRAAEAGSE